jgi:hypothetical protein
MTTRLNLRRSAAALAALLTFDSYCDAAEVLRIQAPPVLARNSPLGAYSPLISFNYSDLKPEPYTLKVWLLEDGWNCASSQWCEQSFAINSRREGYAHGALRMALPFDVFDYGPSLTWVARLFDGSGIEVASAKVSSKTVSGTPPVLKPVGNSIRNTICGGCRPRSAKE